MKKLFKIALTLGAIFSLTACGTEEDPSSSDTNPPASENNPAPDDGTTNNNNTNGTNNTNLTAASMIKEMKFDEIDPAEDILGSDSSKTLAKKAALETYATDREGGKCVEEADYFAWKDFSPMKGTIASNVVEQCKGFSSSMFETIEMLRSFLPDDAAFNTPIHVEPNVEVGPGYYMDLPIDFYLEGDINDYTFYYGLVVPNMVNQHAGFRFIKGNDEKYAYSYNAFSVNEHYDYMPLSLIDNTMGDTFIKYDTTNKRYNIHNRQDEYFEIRQVGTEAHPQMVLNSGSEAYAHLEEDDRRVVLDTAQALDYFFFENTNGKLNVTIQPADGTSDVGNSQRLEAIPSIMRASWKPGSFYERITLHQVPAYARGRSGDSFFRAEKGDDGYWVVYSRTTYNLEFIAKQTADGWFMLRNLKRQDDGTFDSCNEISIASQDAVDICDVSLLYNKQIFNLSAFNGYDELRQYDKSAVSTACRLTINGVQTGKYYEGRADIYKNGSPIFTSPSDPMDYESPVVNAGGSYSFKSGGYGPNNDYSNREIYGAQLLISDTLANAAALVNGLGLECDYGEGLDDYLARANDFVDNAATYVAGVNLYQIPTALSREQYFTYLNTLYDIIDTTDDINRIFGLA